jgi:hypothetical protein
MILEIFGGGSKAMHLRGEEGLSGGDTVKCCDFPKLLGAESGGLSRYNFVGSPLLSSICSIGWRRSPSLRTKTYAFYRSFR